MDTAYTNSVEFIKDVLIDGNLTFAPGSGIIVDTGTFDTVKTNIITNAVPNASLVMQPNGAPSVYDNQYTVNRSRNNQLDTVQARLPNTAINVLSNGGTDDYFRVSCVGGVDSLVFNQTVSNADTEFHSKSGTYGFLFFPGSAINGAYLYSPGGLGTDMSLQIATVEPVVFGNGVDIKQLNITKAVLVTQITSLATAVTSNGYSGTIATVSSTLAANTSATFTVNNNLCLAANRVQLQLVSYTGTQGGLVLMVSNILANSFDVTIRNTDAALAQDGVITFSYMLF